MMQEHESLLNVPGDPIPGEPLRRIAGEFLHKFKSLEVLAGTRLLLLHDKKSDAWYVTCHLDSKELVSKSDLDAVLDPEESEEYKLNREIYTDNYAYQVMRQDASLGRSFEDLVTEYDPSYRPAKPLKVYGGQHRIHAITEAVEKGVSAYHGVRVYFNLSIKQRLDIAVANNTAIAVPNELLDRIHEEFLGTELRQWCQSVGLLAEGQNFADRRNPEGVITVRVARTLLVNLHKGRNAAQNEFDIPLVCSSGPNLDENYRNTRMAVDWQDQDLKAMGLQFARLHNTQRQRVLGRKKDGYLEFANKAIHPCVAASWAYAAGLFQHDAQVLRDHYALADVSGPEDPLNAKALSTARLKGVDPDTYRGLGARINNEELGRMLEVFRLQAKTAKERGITLKLANAAVKSYEARKATREAERAMKGI